MPPTTAGRILIDAALPPALRGRVGELDVRGVRDLGELLAALPPDEYRAAMKKLSDVSARAGYEGGGYSFGPEDTAPGPRAAAARAELRKRVAAVLADRTLAPADRDARLVHHALEAMTPLRDAVYEEGLVARNPLALQVKSGAKGKADNLKALTVGDTLYTDNNYQPIPYPILHSFAEGLRPHEFMAGSFGARQSIVLTKIGTAGGGWLCLAPTTLVRMADGTARPIIDLKPGNRVIGVDRDGVASPTTVMALIPSGVKKVYRFTFRPGRSRKEVIHIDATDDHKALFTIKNYWRVMSDRVFTNHRSTETRIAPLSAKLTDPRNASYLLKPVDRYVDTGLVHEPRALLLGMLLGDGCLTYPAKTTLACGDHCGIVSLAPYLASIGLRADRRTDEVSRIEYTLNSHGEDRGSVDLRRWLDHLGLRGHKAPTKFIPGEVWGWTNESVAAMVAGLFITDGTGGVMRQTGRPVVRFAMTAGRLISTLRDLLGIRFGIYASPMRTQTAESLTRANVMSTSRGTRLGRDPKIKNRTHVVHRNPMNVITISNRDHLRRFTELVRHLSHQRVRDLVDAVDNMPDSDDDLSYGYAWVGREEIGEMETYDIEVDHPDHLFLLANGAVVSNSKRINNLAHRLVVTDKDGPEPDTVRGLAVPLADPDNEGAMLAAPTGGHPRNTVLTRDVIADLKRRGVGDVLVRSPLVGGPADGGVYGYDVGVREKGGIAPRGDFVGLTAGQSLCLAAGTLVRMADGSAKPIEAVDAGDVVLGCSVDGVLRPTRVVRRYDNGVRPVYETVFRCGTGKTRDENYLRVTSTLEHKILGVVVSGRSDRRPLAEIREIRRPVNPHDRYYAKLASGYDDAGCRREPFALALGLLIGDGCYTDSITSNGVMFSCHDPILVADTKDYFATLACHLAPQTTPGEYRVSRMGGAVHPVRGTARSAIRNPVRSKLVHYGMWGQRSHTKTLPDTHDWDNASVAALLGGLLATDGCVSLRPAGVCVSFGSTSLALVRGLRDLLVTRFGVVTSAPCSNVKKRVDGGSYRPQYKIAINGWDNVRKVVETIPIPGVKGSRIREMFAAWRRGSKCPESGRCSFVSQEYVGDRETYDIEVAHPDHLFMLDNGLVVSNSEPITQMIIGCLAGGTQVRMADGTVKCIEDVLIGDLVLGVDANPHGTPQCRPVRVTQTFDNGRRPCRVYTFKTSHHAGRGHPRDLVVTCTEDHKILTDWRGVHTQKPAGEIYGDDNAFADVLLVEGGYVEGGRQWTAIASMHEDGEPAGDLETYDIEVDHPDHLFVLANGLIVSNSKHGGGVAGAAKGQQGFPVLERMFSVPSTYPGGATHAETDGLVTSVRPAPQGGHLVTVDGHEHYARPELEVTAKPGDRVEAGDVLTDGVPNPAKFVEHKGIGEGRRLFLKHFTELAAASGFRPHRRNVELVVRGLIDHVRVDQEFGDHVPGDVVSYQAVEHGYRPRPGYTAGPPGEAAGRYLERPALHYTVGTRVTPSVAATMTRHGVDRVVTHPDPPPFTPVMVRSQDTLAHDPDWMTQGLGSGLEKNLLRATARGAVADPAGTSYVPALAEGLHFGDPGTKTRGWDPAALTPPGG